MSRGMKGNVLSSALAFALSCFEYVLIFAPFFMANLRSLGGVLVALLSVFAFSLSTLIDLAKPGKIRKLGRRAGGPMALPSATLVFAALALVLSFGGIAVVANSGNLVGEYSSSYDYLLAILGLLLAPRTLLGLLILVADVSRARHGKDRGMRATAVDGQGAQRSAMKRDREAFDSLWSKAIVPLADKQTQQDGVRLRVNAQARVWKCYKKLNKRTSARFMRSSDARLDRHKVSACYMYAIVMAQPLKVSKEAQKRTKRAATSNEQLAISVACVILSNFIVRALNDVQSLSPDERRAAKEQAMQGVKFPEQVGHGTYEGNFVDCLCHAHDTGVYDVHLMSKLLFHWDHLVLVDDVYYRALVELYSSKGEGDGQC